MSSSWCVSGPTAVREDFFEAMTTHEKEAYFWDTAESRVRLPALSAGGIEATFAQRMQELQRSKQACLARLYERGTGDSGREFVLLTLERQVWYEWCAWLDRSEGGLG